MVPVLFYYPLSPHTHAHTRAKTGGIYPPRGGRGKRLQLAQIFRITIMICNYRWIYDFINFYFLVTKGNIVTAFCAPR